MLLVILRENFFQQNPEVWVGPVSYNNPLEDVSCAGIVRSPLAAGTDLKKSEAFWIAEFSSWVLEIQICFESTGQQQQDRGEWAMTIGRRIKQRKTEWLEEQEGEADNTEEEKETNEDTDDGDEVRKKGKH